MIKKGQGIRNNTYGIFVTNSEANTFVHNPWGVPNPTKTIPMALEGYPQLLLDVKVPQLNYIH